MLLTAELGIGVLLVAYLLLFVKSKLRRKPAETQEKPKPEKSDTPKAVSGPLPVFPFGKSHEVPIPGSELRYCRPFGPLDSLDEIWCKFQTFTSPDSIVVRLNTPDTAPLFKSAFNPDGVVHSSGPMFREQFANGIQRVNWPSLCRDVRALSSFSVPADAPEGKYHIYTGRLFVELKNVPLSGVPFLVRAAFVPNLRLIPRHFSNCADYMHCPAASSDGEGGMAVGFPWSLGYLTLYSEEQGLASGLPEFVSSLKANYEKYAQAGGPSTETVFTDGVVTISVSQGPAKSSSGKYVQVVYAPAPHGSLDEFSGADQEFIEFAKGIRERRVPVITSPMA